MKKESLIWGIGILALLSIILVSAIGSTNYDIRSPVIGGGGNANSTSYATGLVVGEIAGNTSSANYATGVGFYYTLGVVNTSEITLNSGWNLISLDMRQGDTGTDRNISLVAGLNLIGYSAIAENFTLSEATFHDGTTEYTWAEALASGKQHAYLSYYDASSATASERKFKYVSTISGMDDTQLRNNKGYWIYSNVSGNLTLPGVGGSYSNATYGWSSLYFRNSSGVVKSISDAGTANWLTTTLKKYGLVGTLPNGDPDYDFIDISSGNLESWKGYFVYSNVDNLTLIRQN